MIEYKKLLLKKTNQVLIDILLFLISFIFAYVIRFEGRPEPTYLKQLLVLFPYVVLARLLCFYIFSIYSIVWRYISIRDVLGIAIASFPVTALFFLGRILLPSRLSLLKVPLSVIALEYLLAMFGTLGVRMARRLIVEFAMREKYEAKGKVLERRTLLVGAGDAGNMVVKELKQRTDLGIIVVGFIDDDPQKFRTTIQGVKVLGSTSQIANIARRHDIDEAIITIANASSKEIRRIVDICETTKIKVNIIPGLFEILGGHVSLNKIRGINIEDLLGRSVVSFENHRPEVLRHYRKKTILVTGAGGSIGSELCRQLAGLEPKKLILLDKDENGIFEICWELSNNSPPFKLIPLVADITNRDRIQWAFERHRPQVIFHAAAHKHVPLMEINACEVIQNNILGTRNVAQCAETVGSENFVFISTDKAVNPSSLMGASKKIGEMLIQVIAAESTTHFSVVRFGNVLGSRGSVVPLFQKQIAQGGPVTITHPQVQRYFMSISEAVQLIIQAGSIGNRGEIFALDMGKQVKIIDLAKDLIRLSGHDVEDIEIRYIGLRSGEKISEEILVDAERMKTTQFKKIFITPPLPVEPTLFALNLDSLLESAQSCREESILDRLEDMGIGYRRS
jgi:FlaA1/EpsC-like NDP-sugar epimerase